MYEISSQDSFNNIEKWMETINENSGNKMVIVLIDTKCDSIEERVISKESGEALSRKYEIHFFETSIKNI